MGAATVVLGSAPPLMDRGITTRQRREGGWAAMWGLAGAQVQRVREM